jgi:hypothetical protein
MTTSWGALRSAGTGVRDANDARHLARLIEVLSSADRGTIRGCTGHARSAKRVP